MMDGFDLGYIQVWTGPLSLPNGVSHNTDQYIDEYLTFARESGLRHLGVIPWKLLKIQYSTIMKDPNYLAEWLPKIGQIIEIIQKCEAASADPREVDRIYSGYIRSICPGGFSDE